MNQIQIQMIIVLQSQTRIIFDFNSCYNVINYEVGPTVAENKCKSKNWAEIESLWLHKTKTSKSIKILIQIDLQYLNPFNLSTLLMLKLQRAHIFSW